MQYSKFYCLVAEWLTERQQNDGIQGAGPDFEEYSKEFLDDLLCSFYAEIRTKEGKWYGKSSYCSIRAAIQRHLVGAPWNVDYFLTQDSAFNNSNQVLKGIFKKLSRDGMVYVKHHNAIEKGDFQKLKDSGTIGTNDPKALQRLVWLNIAMHFARRGREGYRTMSKDMFHVAVDGEGHSYIAQSFFEKTKNHQGASITDDHMPQGRIYAIEGDEYCPVRAYERYISLLNPDVAYLWQKPNPNYLKTGNWYTKNPLGHNILGSMLKNMCIDANLSNKYTNHCTRVTASVMLNEGGFNETDIIKVTGHKSTTSLKHYNHRATTSKKREMSDSINKQMNFNSSRTDMVIPVIQCDELDELTDQDMLNVVSDYEAKVESETKVEGMFKNCIFKNATFNININK